MKTVNPKVKIPYILKADEAILARRKILEEERKSKEKGEQAAAEATDAADAPLPGPEAPEVLDPAWRPTVIGCNVLTAEEHAYIQDMHSPGEMMLTVLDFGMVDIVPFEDEAGLPIELVRDNEKKSLFGKKPWKRSCLSRIAAKDREEIATFILTGCKLKEAEAKNS